MQSSSMFLLNFKLLVNSSNEGSALFVSAFHERAPSLVQKLSNHKSGGSVPRNHMIRVYSSHSQIQTVH